MRVNKNSVPLFVKGTFMKHLCGLFRNRLMDQELLAQHHTMDDFCRRIYQSQYLEHFILNLVENLKTRVLSVDHFPLILLTNLSMK